MTKEELKSYRTLKEERRELRRQLGRMERAADKTKLREILRNRLREVSREMSRVERAVDSLEDRERRVLRARYLEGLSWDRIYEVVGYEQAQTFRIHKRAIQKLEELKE